MRNLPVHWSEGLFLRPHHFQASDRYWDELIRTSGLWDHHYNYGLRSLTLSKEAIGNYQVEVVACEARLKDGTIVSRGVGQELERVDLKPAFEKQPAVTVYLATSKLKLGRANVGRPGSVDHPRYVENMLSFQDESAGGNDQEISVRDINVRVMLSTDDISGYEVLPIARIKRASEREAAPQVDDDYFPPMITVDAWPELSRGIVRAIYDLLGERLEVVAEVIRKNSMTLASQQPGDLERVWMTAVLNEAYATLGCMAFASGCHPLTVYNELCRIVGALSIFGPDRRVGEIPRYDHDDLARIFKWVKKQIEMLLPSSRADDFERRDFVGAGRGMQVTLESKWLSPTWNWFVGVHVQSGNLNPRECQELLSPGQLDWKMASSGEVDLRFKHRAEGVTLSLINQVPRALPSHGARGEWIYYQVSRGNSAWDGVVREQSLAMRFKESLITNLNELKDKTALGVHAGNKSALLEFALFAVPNPAAKK